MIRKIKPAKLAMAIVWLFLGFSRGMVYFFCYLAGSHLDLALIRKRNLQGILGLKGGVYFFLIATSAESLHRFFLWISKRDWVLALLLTGVYLFIALITVRMINVATSSQEPSDSEANAAYLDHLRNRDLDDE